MYYHIYQKWLHWIARFVNNNVCAMSYERVIIRYFKNLKILIFENMCVVADTR